MKRRAVDLDKREFEGRKIIVFGASSGIGRACAIQLGQRGANVILVARNQDRLKETASHIPKGHSAILPCDVSDFGAAEAVVKEAVKLDGVKLDGCVFSAGIVQVIPVAAIGEQALLKGYQTNLFSLYAIGRAFSSRRVSRDGASFVSLSSISAILQDKGQSIYAAAKAAINTYTSVAALELAPRGIRVNAVCPHMVDTPMASAYLDKMTPEQVEREYPLGKLTPEDIADTVLFLLSDASKKITGQAIAITAGCRCDEINSGI